MYGWTCLFETQSYPSEQSTQRSPREQRMIGWFIFGKYCLHVYKPHSRVMGFATNDQQTLLLDSDVPRAHSL